MHVALLTPELMSAVQCSAATGHRTAVPLVGWGPLDLRKTDGGRSDPPSIKAAQLPGAVGLNL